MDDFTPNGSSDLVQLASAIKSHEISPREIVTALLERIEALDSEFRLYITVLESQAREMALEAEREIVRGNYRGPLHGIPVSLKDLFWTKGIRTTAGSRVLHDRVPTQNAAVVDCLQDAGAIIIAKANMKEFACAPSHPDFGATANPWCRTRMASGSSGGSAAAVAIGTDYGSMGSDTGGSIRVPASFCGVAGFKPSFGLISRFGMETVSPTLDHAGPIGRSVRDIAALLDATSRPDPRDPACIGGISGSYLSPLMNHKADRCDGMVVGVVTDLLEGVDDTIRDAFEAALRVIEETGARVRPITIKGLREDILKAHKVIVWAEAAYSHQDLLNDVPALYSPTLLQRLEEAQGISAIEYQAALAHRERLRKEFELAGTSIDLFVLPTVPCPALALEPANLNAPGSESDVSDLMTRTAPFNMTGQPALSIPCGFSPDGLPIGLELVGRFRQDEMVLKMGYAYQLRTDWHKRRPPVGLPE